MHEPDEALFERYRSRGDAAALGELFDRAAPALLRIALHLARDPAAAEDLLQGTFLLAIEARAEWDASRPLMPWLCGILHNRARSERKRGARTPDAARLPPPRASDPAVAAEAAEFDAAVDAAIAGLPELYRPVLRLHLAYSHAPAEIAHALERPPATVRSQLARGLELLRKALPPSLVSGFGIGALAGTAGRGLAAVRLDVLGHAALAAKAAAAAGTIVGGTMAMKKLVLAGAAAAIAAAAWLVWPGPAAVSPPTQVRGAGVAPAIADDAPAAAGDAGAGAAASERDRAVIAAPATTGSLRVLCTWGDDGLPAAGVQFAVTPFAVRDGDLLARECTTAADGTALVAALPSGKTELAADRGGELQVDVEAGRTVDARLAIPAGILVRGRVVDEHGAPVPQARVWLSSRNKNNYTDGRHVAATAADGRFALRGVEPERFVSAHAPGYRAAAVQPVRGAIGSAIEIGLVLRGAGASLLGRVVDPDGAAVADARVQVGMRENGFAWSPGMFGDGYRPPLALRCDGNGCFRADGLVPGDRGCPLFVRAPGFCLDYQLVAIAAAGDTSVVVHLRHGTSLTGRVTDGKGAPVAGAFVGYRSSAWWPRGEFYEVRHPEWACESAMTDRDGRYRIDTITPGTLRLRANDDERETRGELAASEGETATWDAVLVDVAIAGRVVDERGAPLAGCQVTAMPPRGKGNMAGVNTDADGRFRCPGLQSVPHLLTVCAAHDDVRARPIATLRGVLPGSEPLLVRVPDAAIPSAAIEGLLLDVDGKAPAKGAVRIAIEGLHYEPSVDADPATGRFRIAPLPAGRFRLQGSVAYSRRSAWSDAFALGPRQTLDVGVLQMPATGSIALRVRGPDGAPLHDVNVALVDAHEWGENPWLAGKTDHGSLRIADVAPGSYRLRVVGGIDLPMVQQEVTVAAGKEIEATLDLPKGMRCRLVLSPISEPVPMHLFFEWTRDGAPWQRYENWWEANGERTWNSCLLPGSYEVAITSETGKRAVNCFTIGPDDPPDRAIAIVLP